MKNLIKALLLVGIISCQQSATDNSEVDSTYEVEDTAPSMYAVSLAEALKNIDYYDTLAKSALGVDPVKGFTIRSVDLVEAIGMPRGLLQKAQYSHVRIYMGLDSATSQFKIYLTPVDGARLSKGIAGKDVILNGPYDGDGDGVSDDDGDYVLDFSKPCPTTCPEDIL